MSDRILVISSRYWPENYKINDICEEIARKGYRVDVLCGQPNFPSGQFFEGYHTFGHSSERHGHVCIYRCAEIKRGEGTGFGIMLNYIFSSAAKSIKLRKLLKNRYKAVFCFQTSPVMTVKAALKAGKKQHIPVVTYVYDLWPESMFREMDMQNLLLRKIFSGISRRAYLRSDMIVTANNTTADYFTRELRVHPGRVSVIPLGASDYPAEKTEDIYLMEKYAGSFNVLIFDETLKKQDIDTILKCAVLIRNSDLYGIRLILVTSGNTSALKKKVSKLKVTDVVFAEEEKDPFEYAKYARIAAAFLSCEKTAAGDKFSNAEYLADFMHLRRPVLFAGDGEGKRIVKESGCGFTSDPEDAEGLFDIIAALYKCTKAERTELGETAYKYQQKNLNRKECTDRILELLLRDEERADDEFIINSNTNIIKADDIDEE